MANWKLSRRRILHLAAGAVALPAVSHTASAQAYPARPITLIVTFAAGGPNDVVARILAFRMSEILGQQVIIENVVGAGGMTGFARVAKAPPDGYQFVIAGPGFVQAQTLYKNPLYNAATDFTPLSLITEGPMLLIARKDFPASNFKDFVRYAKTNQGKLQFGSGGAGSGGHITCVLLNSVMGANVMHIPYRGSGPALLDLQGGRIDYMCDFVGSALPPIESGTVRAIATLSPQRSPILPYLATAHEQGLTGFDTSSWYAFLLPKGTAEPIVGRLNAATSEALNTSTVRERLLHLGVSAVPPERRGSEYLAKFIPSEIEKWAAAIKAGGVSIE